MSLETERKLDALRRDYTEVVGNSFQHFFCPILFRDEAVSLCRAHLINQAFSGSSAKWTLQRADVDNFFGSIFESDFTALRYMGSSVENFFNDPSSVKHLRPQTYLNGKKIEHYIPSGPVPAEHLEVEIKGSEQRAVRLGFKIQRSELLKNERMILEVGIEKDCRMPALVSVIKSAHLILFQNAWISVRPFCRGSIYWKQCVGFVFAEEPRTAEEGGTFKFRSTLRTILESRASCAQPGKNPL